MSPTSDPMTPAPPRARRTDPETSQQAGLNVTNLRASQARILQMFRLYGDLYDKQLEKYLHDAERAAGMTRLMSSSGIRSRRSELCKPNMERLDELLDKAYLRLRKDGSLAGDDWRPGSTLYDAAMSAARACLRHEGFRSPLWDTGKRAIVDGRTVILWGIAV
jgi:hypothetical protein